MAVRVHDATEAPSILVGNRPHGLRPGFYRTRESSVGIIDRQNHTDSSSIRRLHPAHPRETTRGLQTQPCKSPQLAHHAEPRAMAQSSFFALLHSNRLVL